MCNCILVLLALIFPPLPVWIKCGLCSAESLISIALTILGYIPGVIHAIYIIAKYPIHYVVLDEESQTYRRHHGHSHRQRRTQQGPPRVIIRERVSTPSCEHMVSDQNVQYYGSTSNENPPNYEQVIQQDFNQQQQPSQSRQSQGKQTRGN